MSFGYFQIYPVHLAHENQCEAILEAFQSDSPVENIKLLKKKRININANCPYPWESGYLNLPPMLWAVHEYEAPVIKALVDSGADVNSSDETGVTPLMWARDAETGRALIAAGARVNQRDNGGKTALMYATIERRIEIVKLLIGAKARVNIVDAEGNSALMIAATNGDTEVISLLLAAQADASVKNKAGSSALDLAKKSGKQNAVRLLQRIPENSNKSATTEQDSKAFVQSNRSNKAYVRIHMQDGSIFLGELISENQIELVILQNTNRFQIKKSQIRKREPVEN